MNTAKFIRLHMVYDHFCTTTAELSTCSRDVWPTKFSYLLDPYTKKVYQSLV